MALPTRLGTKAYLNAAYGNSLSSSSDPIDFGTAADRYCVVQACALDNNSTTTLDSVTINGVAMTGSTDRNMFTDVGVQGRSRMFILQGASMPTGVQPVLLTAGGVNGRLLMTVEYGNASTAVSAPVYFQVSSQTPQAVVSSATADEICSWTLLNSAASETGGSPSVAPLSTFAAEVGTTLGVYLTPTAGHYHSLVLHKAGVGSVTLGAVVTNSFYTPASWGYTYRVAGVVGGATAPSITTHPVAQNLVVGQTMTMSVVATGTATLTYQWQRGGVTITGATSASYSLSNVQLSDSGAQFRCVVSNGTAPAATSNNALLTVTASTNVAPTITTQPTAQTRTAGQTATFTVTATGTALTYQWQRNPGGNTSFANISAATAASYTTPVVTVSGGSANSGDTYRVIVTGDTAPAVTSNAVALTVATNVEYGFDFHTLAGCKLTSFAGSGAALNSEIATQVVVVVQNSTTDVEVCRSGTLVTDSNSRLPRFTHASLAGPNVSYDVKFKPIDGREPYIKRVSTT